uniref:Uncharacterized protein n=1 Tax=Opuntia streptacantha TaxID=393608 RepID=A0A7C9DEF9_OPUST
MEECLRLYGLTVGTISQQKRTSTSSLASLRIIRLTSPRSRGMHMTTKVRIKLLRTMNNLRAKQPTFQQAKSGNWRSQYCAWPNNFTRNGPPITGLRLVPTCITHRICNVRPSSKPTSHRGMLLCLGCP